VIADLNRSLPKGCFRRRRMTWWLRSVSERRSCRPAPFRQWRFSHSLIGPCTRQKPEDETRQPWVPSIVSRSERSFNDRKCPTTATPWVVCCFKGICVALSQLTPNRRASNDAAAARRSAEKHGRNGSPINCIRLLQKPKKHHHTSSRFGILSRVAPAKLPRG
jgi:hypothetical protein